MQNTIEQRSQSVEFSSKILCPQTTSRDSPLPSLDYLKISGGIFHDCAVHDIDLITWILGEYPTEVTIEESPTTCISSQVFSAANSVIPEIGEINDWDNVAIVMKFPSSTLAQVKPIELSVTMVMIRKSSFPMIIMAVMAMFDLPVLQIDLCRFSIYGYDQRLEVMGPKGMLHVKNETPNKTGGSKSFLSTSSTTLFLLPVFSGQDGSAEVPMYYSFPSR